MSFDLHPIELTPERWQAVRARFKSQGVTVPDEASGEIDKDGIKAQFTYDGQVLRVTIIDKPWLYPAGTVAEKLTEFITEA